MMMIKQERNTTTNPLMITIDMLKHKVVPRILIRRNDTGYLCAIEAKNGYLP